MNDIFSKKLFNIYEWLSNKCLGINPNEKIIILYDEKSLEMLTVIEYTAGILKQSIHMVNLTKWLSSQGKILKTIYKEFIKGDVIIDITSISIYHSNIRLELSKRGLRYVSLSEVDLDIFMRTLNTDYKDMAFLSHHVKKIVDRTSTIEITTKLGTKLQTSIDGQLGFLNIGNLTHKGDYGTLPAGEVTVKPTMNSAEGILVFDKVINRIGLINQPVTAYVNSGEIQHIEGGEAAYQLIKIIDYDANRLPLKIIELGIGTNKDASTIGRIIEASKVLGNITILFGHPIIDNTKPIIPKYYGGVISRATLKLDGVMVIEEGEFIL